MKRTLRVRAERRPGRTELSKAALAGLAGGLAGAWAMSLFSAGWEKALPASAGHPGARTISIEEGRRRRKPPMHASQQEWDSTMNAATAVARVLHLPLPEQQQERGAVAVHYAVGGIMGAAYGLMREFVPEVGMGAGSAFGAAVFVLAQEIGTPRVGLSKPLGEYSFTMHANSLGEHVAWGITTDLVRRAVRRAL
jgi:uncharacterized membrane protein YagU involved in acid resistance